MSSFSRRPPPPVPEGAMPPPLLVWRLLLKLWAYVVNAYSGLPQVHEETHLATGSDPLQRPGLPETLGDQNEVGSGPSYSYEDHIHASGLTAKGDLLTHDASDNHRLAVGTDGQSLVADSTQSAGVKWGTPQSSEDAELLAWIL
jgi:hypothetical protein